MTPDELNNVLLKKIKVLSETTWDRKADQPKVERWLQNFLNEEERIHSLYLLSQFMYFGDLQMKELLRSLYRDLFKYRIVEQIRKANKDTTDFKFIESKFKTLESKTLFLGIGNPSESGTHLLYFFRQENRLSRQRFINTFEIFKKDGSSSDVLRFADVERYVFIDDFCGSGSQAKKYSEEIIKRIKAVNPDIHTSYLMLFATKQGKEFVKKHTKFDYVEALVELDESFKCFSLESRYFTQYPSLIQKSVAQKICEKHGFALYKSIIENDGFSDPELTKLADKHKLGFNDCQLLIGFFHNTPDNTLPTIWYDENHIAWYPIFRRYNKIY